MTLMSKIQANRQPGPIVAGACTGALTAACNGIPAGTYRLTPTLTRPLCGPCVHAAELLGMGPVQLHGWVARAQERRLPAVDLSGRAVA